MNIDIAVQGIMLKLKDLLTWKKFEAQGVATQAKRLATAGYASRCKEIGNWKYFN